MIFAEECSEGRGYGGVVSDKFPVKTGETQKPAESGWGSRNRPIKHGGDFVGVRGDTMGRNNVAQIVELVLGEETLGLPEKELAVG